jgi:uracil-DNA glycosylase
MTVPIALHSEFAQVISCSRCSSVTDRHLLRDEVENVPQPGYVGSNYLHRRVLLVGQNPGTPKSLSAQDRPYTAALRALRDEPSSSRYDDLEKVLKHFIPQWPVHGNYFPLAECGLTLSDIAYCNVVRCRTSGDKKPGRTTTEQCVAAHFTPWLRLLAPRVIVFIGKWAADHVSGIVSQAGIPSAFMNRQRSLSYQERATNRAEVVALVQSVVASQSFRATAYGRA